MNRRFDVVLFDLGSTLLYFDGNWPEVQQQANLALAAALQHSGCPLDVERFLPLFGERMAAYYQQRETEFIEYTTEYTLRKTLAEIGCASIAPGLARSALNVYFSVSQAHWKLEPDAVPMLTILLNQGYRLGMISNASDAWDVHRLVDQAGLRPFFELILISAEVGMRKPHPAIFQMAVDYFRRPAGRMVMVGDTLGADVLGAQNFGMAAVWITRRADRPDNRAREDAIQPDAVIHALAELPEVLQQWPEQKP